MCRVFDLHYNLIMLFVDKQAQIPHARKTCFLTHLRLTTCGGSDPVGPWFLSLCLPTFNCPFLPLCVSCRHSTCEAHATKEY